MEVAAVVGLCSEDGSILLTSLPRDPQPCSLFPGRAAAECLRGPGPKPHSLCMSERFLACPGPRIQRSADFPALGEKGDALCHACPAAFALSGCWRQSGTRACAVPSRGTLEVSPCLSASFEEASASRETQQPLCAAAITCCAAHGAVLWGEGRTPSLWAAPVGTEQAQWSGVQPSLLYETGWLGHCCHEVCQVAMRHRRDVQGSHGAGCAACPAALHSGAFAKTVRHFASGKY